jgi:2-dehydropantoate 2-reductase
MNDIKTVSLIGLGALGILYAYKLKDILPENGLRIIVDSQRMQKYQKEGVYCNGELCEFHYYPPDMPVSPADLLMICTKSTGLSQAIKDASGHVGPDTVVLSAINGITSEEIIGRAYGLDKVLYAVAQNTDATRLGTHLTYHAVGSLALGEKDKSISPRLLQVKDLLVKAGIGCELSPDILRHQWSKFMFNVGLNQVTTVFETNYGGVQKEGEPRQMMLYAMDEVRRLSLLAGINLTEKDIQYWMDMLATLGPECKPSMRQDAEACRPTELALFAGTVRNLGKEFGMDTPINDFLFEKISAMEANYGKQ